MLRRRVFFGGFLVFSLLLTGTIFAKGISKIVPVVEEGPNGLLTYLDLSESNRDQKKIIGKNDMIVVEHDGSNIPSKYRDLMDAFGKLSMGCTATHIGNGIAITAGHCFRATEKLKKNVSCRFTVNWGYRVDVEPYLKSRCTTILAMQTNMDTDFAIFKVDPIPESFINVSLDETPLLGDPITIFGHPEGRPLEWSQECKVDCSSKFKYAGKDQFTHQCDTLAGNSGSSVINTETLEVVGIHDGGIAPWNYGTFVSMTPIKSIMEDEDDEDKDERTFNMRNLFPWLK